MQLPLNGAVASGERRPLGQGFMMIVASNGATKIQCLTTTYSHMGRPHTTIGAETFHC